MKAAPMAAVKRVASVKLGKMVQPDAPDGTQLFEYVRAAHVQPNGRLIELESQRMPFTRSELRTLDLREGDVVVVEGGAGYGRSAVLESNLPGWGFQNSIVRLRVNRAKADGRFLDYSLQSALASGLVDVEVATATIPHFTAEKVARLIVPSPPLDEQRAIADYLDRETARIDKLMAKQERLIETLRERRAVVIEAAMERHSSELVPLKRVLGFQEGPGIMAEDFRDKGVPLLRVKSVSGTTATADGCNFLEPGEVERRWARFRVQAGDLLISASASMGTVSRVPETLAGAIPYTGIIRLIEGEMTANFARWFVVSPQFLRQIDQLKTGSTMQHFGPTHLAQVWVGLPSRSRQSAIALALDQQTAKIDTLIAKTQRFIELSRERRSALITAAVTGQIDVREAA